VTLGFDNGVLSEMSGVRQGESEQVLSADGPLYVQPATPVPGVAVEDARDYEDLSLVPDEFDYWTLQFGSFSYRSEANERLEALESAGVDATIYGQVIGDVGFFVVRSGRYTSREEALRALDRLEERTGLRGFIVTPGS
jgi:cell division septation protein DedD